MEKKQKTNHNFAQKKTENQRGGQVTINDGTRVRSDAVCLTGSSNPNAMKTKTQVINL